MAKLIVNANEYLEGMKGESHTELLLGTIMLVKERSLRRMPCSFKILNFNVPHCVSSHLIYHTQELEDMKKKDRVSVLAPDRILGCCIKNYSNDEPELPFNQVSLNKWVFGEGHLLERIQ